MRGAIKREQKVVVNCGSLIELVTALMKSSASLEISELGFLARCLFDFRCI